MSINAAAVAFAGIAAKGLTAEEIAVLGAFFTVAGDSLATIAAAEALGAAGADCTGAGSGLSTTNKQA